MIFLNLHIVPSFHTQLMINNIFQIKRTVLNNKIAIIFLIEVVIPRSPFVKLTIRYKLEIRFNDGILEIAEESTDVLGRVPISYYLWEN